MGLNDWLNIVLQAIAVVVAIIMPMIDWPPPKRKRRKPRR